MHGKFTRVHFIWQNFGGHKSLLLGPGLVAAFNAFDFSNTLSQLPAWNLRQGGHGSEGFGVPVYGATCSLAKRQNGEIRGARPLNEMLTESKLPGLRKMSKNNWRAVSKKLATLANRQWILFGVCGVKGCWCGSWVVPTMGSNYSVLTRSLYNRNDSALFEKFFGHRTERPPWLAMAWYVTYQQLLLAHSSHHTYWKG